RIAGLQTGGAFDDDLHVLDLALPFLGRVFLRVFEANDFDLVQRAVADAEHDVKPPSDADGLFLALVVLGRLDVGHNNDRGPLLAFLPGRRADGQTFFPGFRQHADTLDAVGAKAGILVGEANLDGEVPCFRLGLFGDVFDLALGFGLRPGGVVETAGAGRLAHPQAANKARWDGTENVDLLVEIADFHHPGPATHRL